MQIADFLGQYASTLANAPLAAPTAKPGAPAVQSLVSELAQMQEGAVFEGSINSIDGSRVLLGLANGQSIAARLEGDVNLMLGQSVFFQVKSNDGQTIAIKPYTGTKAFNPTIQKALDAAGMEMTKDTIDMVNRMMEEGMPINKQSLAAMRHTLMQNPRVSLGTAVLMTKLGIPVNDQMAAQFENYQNDRHSMLHEMNQVMDGLVEAYAQAPGGAKGLLLLNQQILSVLNADHGAPEGTALFLDAQAPENAEASNEAQAMGQQADTQAKAAVSAENPAVVPNEAQGPAEQADVKAQAGKAVPLAAGQAAEAENEAVQAKPPGEQAAENPRQVGELLNRHQLAQLEAQLKEAFPKAEQMKLNEQLTAKEFLDAVAKQLEQQPAQAFDKAVLGRLFTGKEYHTLLKEVMQEQWTVKPEELKTEHKVEELYQRLNRQMGQIEQLAKQAGMNTTQLSHAAAQVRDNLEFMHQVNQAYTYVQIPLKMANQNAHSDLYVYTNKRNLGKKEGELSAFLHLELENLGTTDVSIKMLENNVSTKFYLEDDASYDLLEEHLPQLQERLEKLGYRCTVTIENREEKVDFVEDFLQKSQPAKAASRGMVHRYSFDMRA